MFLKILDEIVMLNVTDLILDLVKFSDRHWQMTHQLQNNVCTNVEGDVYMLSDAVILSENRNL